MQDTVYQTASEAAEALDVKHTTVTGWIKTGRLKAEQVKPSGKDAYRIRHSDLLEASRGTLFEQPVEAPQMRLDTPEDQRRDALSLEVLWPEERRSEQFSSDILAGFKSFRALTYTVSLPSIFKLLTTQDYELVEVVFGCEALVRESNADKVVRLQEAIETELARTYIGVGGETDERTQHLMAWQASGRAKFYTVGGGVVHSKLYFLERSGLRRVLVGSANLSEKAMSGRQGEVLLAYDNDDWMWGKLLRKYEAARTLASGLRLKTQITPAHLVRAEDLPAGRETKKDKPATIYTFDLTDVPGDPEYLAVRADDLDANIGEALREGIQPIPNGGATIRRAALKKINYAAAAQRPDEPDKLHRLDRVNDRFIYDGRVINSPLSDDGITRDALLISQYINKFQEFGVRSDILQRNYYGLMGWLYFTPFMPALARQVHLRGGNAAKEMKHVAIIYGQSNCGKSALAKFLMISMFGPPTTVDDSCFTQSDFKARTSSVGVLPIYYEDVSGARFAGRSRNQGEVIVKYYDQLVGRTGQYPCAIVTSNAEEFSNEVRNRAFLVYTPKGIASDDNETRNRLDQEVLPLLNRVGQDFYSEYLSRMAAILSTVEDPTGVDYLWESTNLIRTMLQDNLMEGEDLPVWAEATTASDFNGRAWELKHKQMASRLTRNRFTPHFPPASGFWTVTGEHILIGVESVKSVLRDKEVQDHWVDREANYGSGNVLYLYRSEIEESIRRSDPNWHLPVPFIRRLMALSR